MGRSGRCDPRAYEKLIIDGFQAASPAIQRGSAPSDDNSRSVRDFRPEKIARYDAGKSMRGMNDDGIVRQRATIF